jgi:hypothetical protein
MMSSYLGVFQFQQQQFQQQQEENIPNENILFTNLERPVHADFNGVIDRSFL